MTLVKVNTPQKTYLKTGQGKIGFGLSPLFDEVFNDLINGGTPHKPALSKNVAVNIYENENSFFLEFSAPGFDKSDFRIKLESDNLTVSTAKEDEKTESTEPEKNYTRREFSYTPFSRSFTLPQNINAEAINAGYKNGILTLELPKLMETKKQAKEIIVS